MKYMLLIKNIVVVCVLLTSSFVWAKASVVSISDLRSTEKQRQTAVMISQIVQKFHYVKPLLNDDLSQRIFKRYLEALDANKSFFSKEDIKQLRRYRYMLDDALRSGRIDPAFETFKIFRALVEARIAYALALLEKNNFDYSRDEKYQFDRSEADWGDSQQALDDIWRKRLKNDILSLRLSDKPEQEITDTLRKRYQGILRRVSQMNADDVFQAFINAYTLSIEPHTSYMSPKVSENFDITMRLSLQGIGAVLRTKHEHTLIQSVVVGGPADNSGQLHAGDRIIGVAQGKTGEMEDVVGWRLQDVVDKIRGPKDSIVRLNILPKEQGLSGKSNEVTIVRDEIKLEDKAAKSEIIQGRAGLHGLRIGVIELPAFYRDFAAFAAGDPNFRSTTRDVRKLLKELQDQDVDGIVMDLRANGGGSLTEATELTGLFIDEGPVVQVRDVRGNVEVEKDNDPALVYGGPLAVLVDRNSASASEIFAGAIQDYKRGIIIGEPTYGKGTVQTLVDIGRHMPVKKDMGRLRLTMAQFFRVEGSSTQHKGVTPDIVFPTAKGAEEHGERALDNALPWARISPAVHGSNGVTAVTDLRNSASLRIKNDPGFRFLVDQEDELMKLEKHNVVSLNPDKRKAETDQRDAQRLQRLNKLRAYRGLEPLDSLEDDEDEIIATDEDDPEGIAKIMLDESANILADYIITQRPRTAAAKR